MVTTAASKADWVKWLMAKLKSPVKTTPTIPEARPKRKASLEKMRRISFLRAPRAFMTPISWVLSTTEMFKTTKIMMAETTRETAAIAVKT